MGAWIETFRIRSETAPDAGGTLRGGLESDLESTRGDRGGRRSHPTWVRGLKLAATVGMGETVSVAPYVGAWIETNSCGSGSRTHTVAPYVGAWIETLNKFLLFYF